MSDIVIAYRVNDGAVQFVLDADGDVGIFTSLAHASRYIEHNALFRSGQSKWQVIDLDELT